MRIKRALVAATVAGGVAIAGAGLGTGLAAAATPTPTVTASVTATQADHQQPNNNQGPRPGPGNYQPGHNNQGHPPVGWRPGPVQRPDHNSFNYWGQQVTPQWQPQYHQWGFWFFGFWIPVSF